MVPWSGCERACVISAVYPCVQWLCKSGHGRREPAAQQSRQHFEADRSASPTFGVSGQRWRTLNSSAKGKHLELPGGRRARAQNASPSDLIITKAAGSQRQRPLRSQKINMPQEFWGLKCCSCNAFTVQLAKKSPKFNCTLCGFKQPVRIYAKSNKAADVRAVVQAYNSARGTAEAEAELDSYMPEHQQQGGCGEESQQGGRGKEPAAKWAAWADPEVRGRFGCTACNARFLSGLNLLQQVGVFLNVAPNGCVFKHCPLNVQDEGAWTIPVPSRQAAAPNPAAASKTPARPAAGKRKRQPGGEAEEGADGEWLNGPPVGSSYLRPQDMGAVYAPAYAGPQRRPWVHQSPRSEALAALAAGPPAAAKAMAGDGGGGKWSTFVNSDDW